MKFIPGEAALKFKKYVVVSDIHIGFEEYLEEKGYTIPDQTSSALERLKKLSKNSNELIILGDVKHSIFLKNKSRLMLFLNKLTDYFKKIIIIKGNHDGGIQNYTKNYKNIELVSELLRGKTLFIHGHKYASKEKIIKAERVLIGHFHSAHKTRDHLGLIRTRKTWVVHDFDNKKYEKNKKVKTNIKEVIGFPCFNAFFDGTGEKNGPYSKYLKKKEVFTLDLVKLV